MDSGGGHCDPPSSMSFVMRQTRLALLGILVLILGCENPTTKSEPTAGRMARVIYDGNGNDGGTPPGVAVSSVGGMVTVAGNPGSLVRTGFSFAGWNILADRTGTGYLAGDHLTVGEVDLTLYAAWISGPVPALEVSLTGIADITKVSYEFVHVADRIASEVVPSGSMFSLTNPALAGKTWQTTIVVWRSLHGFPNNYSRAYRYRGELTFDGQLQILPLLTEGATLGEGWADLIFDEFEPDSQNHPGNLVQIFRSVDPRGLFTIEIDLPEGWFCFNSSVFRNFIEMSQDHQNLHVLFSDQQSFPDGLVSPVNLQFPSITHDQEIQLGQGHAGFLFAELDPLVFAGPTEDDTVTIDDNLKWSLQTGVPIPAVSIPSP